jgi:hypothetical protein
VVAPSARPPLCCCCWSVQQRFGHRPLLGDCVACTPWVCRVVCELLAGSAAAWLLVSPGCTLVAAHRPLSVRVQLCGAMRACSRVWWGSEWWQCQVCEGTLAAISFSATQSSILQLSAHGCQLPGSIPSCMAGVLGTHPHGRRQHGGKPQTVFQYAPFPWLGRVRRPQADPWFVAPVAPHHPAAYSCMCAPQRWGLQCKPSLIMGQGDCTVCSARWACQKCKGFNKREDR